MKEVNEIILKQDKDHKWVAIPSDRKGYYNIKFYEYYESVGFKLLSVDKDYYTEEILKTLF